MLSENDLIAVSRNLKTKIIKKFLISAKLSNPWFSTPKKGFTTVRIRYIWKIGVKPGQKDFADFLIELGFMTDQYTFTRGTKSEWSCVIDLVNSPKSLLDLPDIPSAIIPSGNSTANIN